MKQEMTSVERGVATLEGQPRDRLPFWPKLGRTYASDQVGQWHDVDNAIAHDYIGSDPILFFKAPLRHITPHATVTINNSGGEKRITYDTKDGMLTELERFTPNVREWHPVKFAIETIEDVRRAKLVYTDTSYEADESVLEEYQSTVLRESNKFLSLAHVGTNSPLMHLTQHKIGLENTFYLLYDYQEEVEELMELMHLDYLKRLEATIKYTPLQYVIAVENTSTSAISPSQFTEYCMPHLTDYGNFVNKHGKKLLVHMCGKIKRLLPEVDTLPVCGIEAFSSPPVGDTTIKDGYDLCPSKVLIGGPSAVTWMGSEDEIIRDILGEIHEAGGDKMLYLTTGGVIPTSADPEMLKRIWRRLRDELGYTNQ